MNALPPVGAWGFVAQREVLADAQHLAEPYIIHRRSFLAVGDNVSDEADADGRLTG